MKIIFGCFCIFLICLQFTPNAYHYYRRVTASCVTGSGGFVDDALYACSREPPQPLTGQYFSADTMALGIPGMCVEPYAQFYFHSARVEGTDSIGVVGNQMMMSVYAKWPRLLAYLKHRHVFESFQFVRLYGSDLGKLGVPLCRSVYGRG